MSVRRLHSEQPASFTFSEENLTWAQQVIGRYPEGRQASAVIPLLMRAQEQEGWVSQPAIERVAEMLDMPFIRVLEVATFYTQFQLQPVGTKAHIQVCGTTPCQLRGAEGLIAVCKRKIAEAPFTLSKDGALSWEEVECAGACVNAPMVQIFKDTYEDLTPEILERLIARIEAGEDITPGTQQPGRIRSAPADGPVTLTDPALYDGSMVKYGLGASGEDTGVKPALLDAPVGGRADNLKEIAGIGPKIEEKLNALGVYHFHQIASWRAGECAYVDAHLSFKGASGARTGWRKPSSWQQGPRQTFPGGLRPGRCPPAQKRGRTDHAYA